MSSNPAPDDDTTDASLSTTDIATPPKRVTGDTLEERLTTNAYDDILPARYLIKDANGELVEDQTDLFERVAKNVALAAGEA